MLPVYLAVTVMIVLMITAWALQRTLRKAGRLHPRHFALPKGWLEILRANVPLYNRLPVDLRERMQDAVMNFVDGKRWKHCGGLETVTTEMKVTIAGQACFLLLAREGQLNFARIHNVLVYPKSSLSATEDPENALPPVDAWPSASVLLAWDAERKTALDLRDEGPGAVREFAARLNPGDGGPARGARVHTAWARVICGQFLQSREGADHGEQLLREHGEEGAEEYFAAATELFFEAPDRLHAHHADLYSRLRMFFKLDPVKWLPAR